MSKTLCLIASILSFVAPLRIGAAQESVAITKIAELEGVLPNDATFRAVALKTPWLYALDRDGDLKIYKVPRDDMVDFAAGFCRTFADLLRLPTDGALGHPVQQLQLQKSINKAGDGNDLEILGDVLALTSRGKLAVFDLAEPSDPQLLGEFGPGSATNSQSIVRAGKIAFLLGSGTIASFDISQSHSPKHLATLQNDCGNWNGCYHGRFLYVSEVARPPKKRTGIAVYDVTNPIAITERHFVKTERPAYHLFVNRDDFLLASLDSKSIFHFSTNRHITVAGTTQIFELDDKTAPKSVAIVDSSGGRSALAMDYGDTTIMICNGLAFGSANRTLTKFYSFFPKGHTLDGFPYHGDHYGQHAALVTDNDISVFEIGKSPSYRLGMHIAFTVLAFTVP